MCPSDPKKEPIIRDLLSIVWVLALCYMIAVGFRLIY